MRTLPRPEGRGGRAVVAAVLGAPMHRQGGEGTGKSTLSWEEHSCYHISIRNIEIYYPSSFFQQLIQSFLLLPELLKRIVRKTGSSVKRLLFNVGTKVQSRRIYYHVR